LCGFWREYFLGLGKYTPPRCIPRSNYDFDVILSHSRNFWIVPMGNIGPGLRKKKSSIGANSSSLNDIPARINFDDSSIDPQTDCTLFSTLVDTLPNVLKQCEESRLLVSKNLRETCKLAYRKMDQFVHVGHLKEIAEEISRYLWFNSHHEFAYLLRISANGTYRCWYSTPLPKPGSHSGTWKFQKPEFPRIPITFFG